MTIGTLTNRVPAVVVAALALMQRGHTVQQQNILNLWRVDGGPRRCGGALVNEPSFGAL